MVQFIWLATNCSLVEQQEFLKGLLPSKIETISKKGYLVALLCFAEHNRVEYPNFNIVA